ncbi:MAG: inositol monophosphatase family protein [Casimicrobiaceae bacterium]
MTDAPLEVAIRAARRSASVILDAARDLARLPAHVKPHDLAAETDGEAEDAIVATLRAAFPEHAVLGEESGHIRGAREGTGYKWIVDPIDGVTNFAHGGGRYAVSIAFARGAVVTHAVVLDPIQDELFTAISGQGAECNGAPIHISACPGLEDALVATVAPGRMSPLLPAHLRLLASITPRVGSVRLSGAPALDLAHLAAGRLDGFFATSLTGWDLAAGTLLVAEAGGRVGDFGGGADFLRSSELIAAAPVVFNELREAMVAARRPAVAD